MYVIRCILQFVPYTCQKHKTSVYIYMHLCISLEAKFRCPRNLDATKEFSNCWRPQQHMVCCLIPGLLECHFLMPSDLPMDSNMEMTLLSHSLDIALERLQKLGRQLPAHLHVQADNTSREMRNQNLAQWGALLVARGLFRSVTYGFLPVGHTHNDVGQRFSTVATHLAGQHTLETDEDCAYNVLLACFVVDELVALWFLWLLRWCVVLLCFGFVCGCVCCVCCLYLVFSFLLLPYLSYLHTCVCIYISLSASVYTYISICAYIDVYINMYMYTYIIHVYPSLPIQIYVYRL